MLLSKYVSFAVKTRILLLLQRFKKENYFSAQLNNKNKKAFVFLAADYGNLGDVAITYAQTHFLQTTLPNYQIVDVPISKTLEGIVAIQKIIQQGDVVTTVGGGNLGDLYDQIEFYRQLVVESFPKNKVISFPQTFDFSETKQGAKALKIAKKIYNSHTDIHFIAREKTSFELMKKHFSGSNVVLTPDIVISLDKQASKLKRNGVVICMRKDKEKNLSEGQSLFITNEIKSRFENISYYDTHINRNHLSIQDREAELNNIWNAFRSAELVVTDRLHGMIFCHITNTPCLVFQNNNHKVRETYGWIKENSNINLVNEFSEETIKIFFRRKDFNNDNLFDLELKFDELKELLK